jgi:hypothetical protein
MHKNQKSTLMNHPLAGTKCYHTTPTHWKSPLTIANLITIAEDMACSTLHNDLLFNAQLNTGFTGLLHLGEMTLPNHVSF